LRLATERREAKQKQKALSEWQKRERKQLNHNSNRKITLLRNSTIYAPA
jgi:hypothetical protein